MKKINRYQIGCWLIMTGLVVWIIETAYFIYLEGWHIKATSKDEIFWDLIVSIICYIGALFIVSAILVVVEAYYKGKLRTKIIIKGPATINGVDVNKVIDSLTSEKE